MNPLRMVGNLCEIHRYRVDIILMNGDEEVHDSLYFTNKEEADSAAVEYNSEVVELDTSNYEWLDGLTFETREDAIAAYELGEEAYNAKLSQPTDHDILMALVGNSENPMTAAQNLGNVLQVMAAQMSTSEL